MRVFPTTAANPGWRQNGVLPITIDEALEQIPETGACWIVWSMETGEILFVRSAATAGKEEFNSHLVGFQSLGVPGKTRYFEAGNVTRAVLEAERDAAVRVKMRVAYLNAWSAAPAAELVRLLEQGAYPPPMEKDFDSRILVDHLWEGHRDELQSVLPRLKQLEGTDLLCEAAGRNLHAVLLALKGDRDSLRAIWRGELPGRVCFADDFLLMDCFAYLQVDDRDILDEIIDVIKSPLPFGICWEAMMTLGKLGELSGPRAAAVIRERVYDSSPAVTSERDRVLLRIETPISEWMRCGACCYGRVHKPEGHCLVSCPECLGLGYVPKEQEPAA